MEDKYKKAIIAGMACGIILVILALIGDVIVNLIFGSSVQQFMNDYTNYYGSYYGSYGSTPKIPTGIWAMLIIDLVLVGLGALTFVAAGVLAVRMAAPSLKNMYDALFLGAIAGVVAEVIHRPFAMVFSFIMSMVQPKPYYYSYGATNTITDAINAMIGSLCCFPIILICGVVLALAGAGAYAALRLKI